MPDVGRVTPGKPIWPEPHRELPERERREDDGKERKRPGRTPEANGEQEPASESGPGHIDEYV